MHDRGLWFAPWVVIGTGIGCRHVGPTFFQHDLGKGVTGNLSLSKELPRTTSYPGTPEPNFFCKRRL